MWEKRWFENIVDWFFVIVLVAIFFVSAMVMVGVFTMPPPLERYQTAYDNCIAEETLSPEQCHDIALMTAFGAGTKTNSVPVPIILPR